MSSIESGVGDVARKSARIRFGEETETSTSEGVNTVAQRRHKGRQRERLLRGMVDIANRGGYASASVSAVIGEAGVSRPTFYEYFSDRDDCFVQAIRDVHRRVLAAVGEAIESDTGENATAAAVEAVVAFASAEPALARFLMSESMAGGPAALDARDEGMAEIAARIEAAHSSMKGAAIAPDLDRRVLLGGIYRVLATRLRRGEPAISKLTDQLLTWTSTYDRPLSEHRWATLTPAARAPRSPHVPEIPIQRTPGAVAPGSPRISEEQVAENHRLRILFATARMAELKGYTATTVTDISKLAGVDPHVFYRLFSGKQDAFLAVHELGFQQVMDITANAFFSATEWPARSWEAGRALTQLLEDNPLVAHVGFVEAHAVGPAAVQRIEDTHIAFTFFLREGLVYRKQDIPPTSVVMEVIVASIFEIVYRVSRHEGKPQVASMLGPIAHVWLTPFLGGDEANSFIERQRTVR